jgi:hypothetical protein
VAALSNFGHWLSQRNPSNHSEFSSRALDIRRVSERTQFIATLASAGVIGLDPYTTQNKRRVACVMSAQKL